MPAWNKITISHKHLGDLYLNQKFSISKIAKFLNCSKEPIYRSLKEYKIPIRNLSEACIKIPVSKSQLQKLYLKDRLSMNQIGKRLGCTHSALVYKFKKFAIKSRGHLGIRRPLKITKEGLNYHYNRGLSLKKIAQIFHCSESGLERRFKNYKLQSRGINNRACKIKKYDFSGNRIEKAYLIGFRFGDLNVIKRVNVISVRCSSTIREQILLIKKLFRMYTNPSTKSFIEKKFNILRTDILCLLNKTFTFLIAKTDKIPGWILKDKILFFSFFAGYSDAEGCFYFKKPRGCGKITVGSFLIATQQKFIIYQLWKNMQRYGIKAPFPRISVPSGIRPGGFKNNKDMWQIEVCRKESLWKLIHLMGQFMKHQNKLKRIRQIKDNLLLRNRLPYCKKVILEVPYLS